MLALGVTISHRWAQHIICSLYFLNICDLVIEFSMGHATDPILWKSSEVFYWDWYLSPFSVSMPQLLHYPVRILE